MSIGIKEMTLNRRWQSGPRSQYPWGMWKSLSQICRLVPPLEIGLLAGGASLKEGKSTLTTRGEEPPCRSPRWEVAMDPGVRNPFQGPDSSRPEQPIGSLRGASELPVIGLPKRRISG